MESHRVVAEVLVLVGMLTIAYAAYLFHPIAGSIVIGVELIIYGSALAEWNS